MLRLTPQEPRGRCMAPARRAIPTRWAVPTSPRLEAARHRWFRRPPRQASGFGAGRLRCAGPPRPEMMSSRSTRLAARSSDPWPASSCVSVLPFTELVDDGTDALVEVHDGDEVGVPNLAESVHVGSKATHERAISLECGSEDPHVHERTARLRARGDEHPAAIRLHLAKRPESSGSGGRSKV